MTFTFRQIYSEPVTTETPTLFRVEAESVDEAAQAAAKQHGWQLTAWNGQHAWYQVDGGDIRYSVWVGERCKGQFLLLGMLGGLDVDSPSMIYRSGVCCEG